MATFCVPVLLLSLLAIGVSLLCKRTFVESFSLSTFALIVCLYLGGLFAANLIVGQFLFCGLLAATWFVNYKKGRLTKQVILCHKQEWLRGAWVLFPVLAVVFIVTIGRELTIYDEYTHWGIVVKDLVNNNALHCIPQAKTDFKEYPPAIALIEYFFCFFTASFKSENIYRGLDVLLIACLLPAFKNIVQGGGFKSHILFGWLALIMLAYGSYPTLFTLLLVDGALALLFASLLLGWFINEIKDFFTVAYVSLTAAVLTLAKGSGVVLVILAFMVILADILLHQGKQISKAGMLFPPVAAATAWLSWRVCTAIYHVAPGRSQGKGMLSELLSIFRGDLKGYQIETVRNFGEAFLDGNVEFIASPISYYQWFLILFFSAIALSFFLPDKQRGRMLVFAMPVVHLVYSGLLLLTYVLSFGEVEGPGLASLSRYMPSCYLGLMLFMAGYLLVQVNESIDGEKARSSVLRIHVRWCIPVILTGVVFAAFSVGRFLGILWPISAIRNQATRQFVAPYQALRSLAQIEERDTEICLIGVGENDYAREALISRYELAPLNCKTVDVATISNGKEIKQALKSADYVFVLPVNELPESEEMQELLAELTAGTDILYRVCTDTKGNVQLQPVA